jgi:hypothetical protein
MALYVQPEAPETHERRFVVGWPEGSVVAKIL